MATVQNIRQRRKLARQAKRRLGRYLYYTRSPRDEVKAYTALLEAQAAIGMMVGLTDIRSVTAGSRTTTAGQSRTTTNRNQRPR